MTISEAHAVCTLIHLVDGDKVLPTKVTRDVEYLLERVHKALQTAPVVDLDVITQRVALLNGDLL
jgi:hypothetical protein